MDKRIDTIVVHACIALKGKGEKGGIFPFPSPLVISGEPGDESMAHV